MVYQAVVELRQWQPATGTACTLAALVMMQLSGWAYALGFPERYFPFVFDLIGSSHQLMHLGVIGVHIVDYRFVWDMSASSLSARAVTQPSSLVVPDVLSRGFVLPTSHNGTLGYCGDVQLAQWPSLPAKACCSIKVPQAVCGWNMGIIP
jgi:hypothetical protein